jgi:serine protease
MVRLRNVFFILALTLLVVYSAHGRGQAAEHPSGVVVGYFAPPAIDRGLMEHEVSHAPDSAETRIRASMQVDGRPAERVGASGARYVAGKFIVKFRAGTSASARVSALSATSAKASTQPPYADFDVVSIDESQDAEAAARAMALRPDVEYAQAAYRCHAEFKPNDPYYSKQWNLPDIDMERAWDIQPDAGSSIVVAVLDTGVAYTNVTMRYHANAFRLSSRGNVTDDPGATLYPSLGDLTLAFVAATELGTSSRFVAPRDFIWGGTTPIDLDGHGTHVSGTIGQLTNNNIGTAGVAFNVKLMPVKVLDSNWDDIFGAPNQGTDDIVAQGVRYAADNGAKVINMSLGRTGPSAPAIEDAIKYAVGKGAFVAIAAGNAFEDGNPTSVIAEIASRVQGAVSVGAVDRGHNRAYYSSTGSYVELVAPGGAFRGFSDEGGILQQTLDLRLVETYLTTPSRLVPPRFDALAYYYFIGTSQATPHVSGLAAMLMQQGITSPAAVEAALEKFATDLGPPGRDNDFGFGEINARNTLRGLGLSK